MIAALYVDPKGVYSTMPSVECWGLERDARTYPGPHPVVAHPPCARWGSFAAGGPRYPRSKIVGDDGGCFASALAAVRCWGGVIEHPAGSKAWAKFGLPRPFAAGGWTAPELFDPGRSCRVEQGHYGHAARKATWLYAVVPRYPDLRWGSSMEPDPEDCPFTRQERLAFARPSKGATPEFRGRRRAWQQWRRSRGLHIWLTVELQSRKQREATPPEFAALLVSLARS